MKSDQSKLASRRELKDALNLILEFCDLLPEGWEIAIYARKDDAEISLRNPDADDVSTEWDGDSLNVRDMVIYAREQAGLPEIGEEA